MYTLRHTRKLLRRIDERPCSEAVTPTTALEDWYANLLYLRPQQLVLAMNERTLLCVLVPAATVAERLRVEVGGLLRDVGVPEAKIEAELAAMEHVTIGTTACRAVLGCMNDAVFQLGAYPRGTRGELDLRAAALYLAENIYSLTDLARRLSRSKMWLAGAATRSSSSRILKGRDPRSARRRLGMSQSRSAR